MKTHFSFEDRKRIALVIANDLLKDNDLTFFARDLGWNEHTSIHEAMKPVLARWVARIIVNHLGEEELQKYLARYVGEAIDNVA